MIEKIAEHPKTRTKVKKEINPLKLLFVGLSLIALIFFIGYVLYDPLNNITKNVKVVSEISDATVKQVDSIVNSNPSIVGAQVISVNLQKNTRYIVYTSIKNDDVKKLYLNFMSGKITLEVPVFTADDAQNSRIVQIINHEFACSPFKETITYKYVPATANFIKTVCAISIPPSYGKFKGIFGVYLSREPTELEKDLLRILLKDAADKLDLELGSKN